MDLTKTSTEEERRLADIIHYKSCPHDHTDGCSYDYRSWENPGDSKRDRIQGLIHAKALLKEFTFQEIWKAMEIVNLLHTRLR